MIDTIEKSITNIGESMVQCTNKCFGIVNEPLNGVLPRCLYFNRGNGNYDNGCVIVGINPGKSAEHTKERTYYLNHGNTYQSQVELWKNGDRKANYYNFLEDFIACLGLNGPVLWTELVKCECASGFDIPNLQTFRNCTHLYLNEELKVIPNNWPLIAIGREAHKALSYIYPNKSVLGVPHPTSSRGQFARLFIDSKRKCLKDEIKTQIDFFNNHPGIELWLSDNRI